MRVVQHGAASWPLRVRLQAGSGNAPIRLLLTQPLVALLQELSVAAHCAMQPTAANVAGSVLALSARAAGTPARTLSGVSSSPDLKRLAATPGLPAHRPTLR